MTHEPDVPKNEAQPGSPVPTHGGQGETDSSVRNDTHEAAPHSVTNDAQNIATPPNGTPVPPAPSAETTDYPTNVTQPTVASAPAAADNGYYSYGPPTTEGSLPPFAAVPPKDKKEKNGRSAALVGIAAAAALIGGLAGGGVTAAIMGSSPNYSTNPQGADNSIVVNNQGDVNSIAAVAAAVSPSVVTVGVSGQQGGGSGSGVVITEDGYVLTNTHVVTLDGAVADPQIQVTLDDGRIFSAKIVGTDPTYDLAVIKLDKVSGLKPIEFADSKTINVGDMTIAIGAPLGLSGTVTNGIVSAVNRSITVASSAAPSPEQQDPKPNPGLPGPFGFWNFGFPGEDQGKQQPNQQKSSTPSAVSLAVIQTDAAINPGNSGGALLNSAGKLIGINVAIASTGSASATSTSGSIGVGFAIPSNVAQRVAHDIMTTGKASHGLLGATVVDSATEKNSTLAGALLGELTAGGAAEKAGLKSGDVITKFNGVPISDATDLTAQVRALPGGAEAPVTYVRNGDVHNVTVVLGQLTIEN